MKISINLLTLVLVVLIPALALAAQDYVEIERRLSPEQMHETGLDTLSASQLERLNQLLREQTAEAVEAAVESAVQPAIVGEPAERASRSFIGLDDKPISSRLKGSIDGWQPGTVFELENGQQWKVLKGSVKLRETLQSPEIKVVPGVAGRWFLQVVEDMPKARVYRID